MNNTFAPATSNSNRCSLPRAQQKTIGQFTFSQLVTQKFDTVDRCAGEAPVRLEGSYWTPPFPGFVPKPVREAVAEAFDPEADFYVYEGRPFLVFGQWDHAEDWSVHPIRSAHPMAPVFNGTQITE